MRRILAVNCRCILFSLLSPGTRLDVFEIVAPIGAGGMGEVYRGRDTKLGRDVAIKVLPAAFSTHPERLDRFEQEARAAGMLNHPNLLSIYELGVHDGAPYIVTELLEGETLRERMQTDSGAAVAIAPRKAIDYATQIANGLAAAHTKGIVHRDLKPENIFITRDDRVKILDFGLAKLAGAPDDNATDQHTVKRNTAPGTVMGTAGYMSPEQVRGQTLDPRSDIFSFGAILYEMLSGRRAFKGDSSVETMNAVLKEDPADLSSVTSAIPPALQRIVDHCLEKSPDARFQSSRDLAFDLQAISSHSDTGIGYERVRAPFAKWLPAAIALALLAAGAAFWVTRPRPAAQPKLHQLTFRRGLIRTARFAPDGQSIIYSAAWDASPLLVFQTRANALESVPLPLPSSDLLAMSPAGDIAIAIGRRLTPWAGYGTLAQASMLATAPRELLENVSVAEWTADGAQLIVVRRVKGEDVLEWPMGKPILRTTGYFDHVRISRDGKKIAFVNHPLYNDNRGGITITDAAGATKTLLSDWAGIEGLAWSPDGKEVWFSGDLDGTIGNFEIYSVDLQGHVWSVWQVPTNVNLMDVSRDGRILVTSGVITGSVYAVVNGDKTEHDLAWMAWTTPSDLSADGKSVLMTSYGAGAGRYYATSVRSTDGSPGTRLAEGQGLALSPDKKLALSLKLTTPPQLLVTPTGAGQTRILNTSGLDVTGAMFLTGNRILFSTPLAGEKSQLWMIDNWENGAPRNLRITIPTPNFVTPSPDGKWIAIKAQDAVSVVPLDGTAIRRVASMKPGARLLCAPDPASLFISQFENNVFHVDRVDIITGQAQHVVDVPAPDMAGAIFPQPALNISADGNTSVTSVTRWLTDLYVVEGVR